MAEESTKRILKPRSGRLVGRHHIVMALKVLGAPLPAEEPPVRSFVRTVHSGDCLPGGSESSSLSSYAKTIELKMKYPPQSEVHLCGWTGVRSFKWPSA